MKEFILQFVKSMLTSLVGGGAGADGVDKLARLIDLLLPHPRSMHLVVKFTHTRDALYVWQPVPPSKAFVVSHYVFYFAFFRTNFCWKKHKSHLACVQQILLVRQVSMQ